MEGRYELRAGIFLLVTLIVTGASILIIGSERQLFGMQDEFRTVFSDVAGLSVGAPIRMGGIKVGRVEDIGYTDDLTDPRIVVSLLINAEYRDRIREDSKVEIRTQGLLGDKFVAINAGTATRAIVPPGGAIPSSESPDISMALSKLTSLVDDAVTIAADIKGFTGELSTGEGLLHTLLHDPQGGKILTELQETVRTLSEAAQVIMRVAGEVETGDGTLHRLVYDNEEELITSIKGFIEKLDVTSEALKTASTALANGEGTLGALLLDPTLYDNLLEITDEAKRSALLRAAIRHSLSK